ncbi:hypothetical protein AX17_000019 [Amanita inopinata Kibby_2008]|nr:hypothetical protein AX17_000019 [Amanita inopinata Kibby_2008]
MSVSLTEIVDQVKVDVLSKCPAKDNDSKRKEIARSFISDTLTVPTEEMYEYARQATLGDDVYFDASTAALEAHVAKLTGKEAAIFMPSGTASNQIALRAHLKQPPYSILCDHRAHIHRYEAGGTAFHSGALNISVIPTNGHHLTLYDIEQNVITENDIHFAPTEVIALENTLNGTIFPQHAIIRISDYAHSLGIKMHLDGARIWHVAVETGKTIKELCDPFDSVSLCFSKGLGAPVGSCLVGTKELVAKAKWFRKLFGGGMRQTGILAASAAYALTHNFPQLPRVHALAEKLEACLEVIGVTILSRAETCMIFYDASSVGLNYGEITDRASALPNPLFLRGSRIVVHIQTTEEAVNDLLDLIRQMAEEKKAAGFVRQQTGQTNGNAFRNVLLRRRSKNKANTTAQQLRHSADVAGMNSDEFFDDIDDAVLEQIDAIEAAALSKPKHGTSTPPNATHAASLTGTITQSVHRVSTRNPSEIAQEDSLIDFSFNIDESELQKIDTLIEDSYKGMVQPVAGSSRAGPMTRQTTLDGGFVVSSQKPSSTRATLPRSKSSSKNPFGQQAPKTKKWDRTEFAKTGLKPQKKRKRKADEDDSKEEEMEDVEFEQFPAPFVSLGPPPPMKLVPDLLEAKHWVYPLNRPKRDYQFNIAKRCLFENTLVALPTGLGKTFIAGVVMLNYYHWFPEGKVVFVAPTKPLVSQQIDACHKSCGIPGTDAAELTGAISRAVRAKYWQAKRVFYMTPQTLVNDLVTENCNVQDIILLVIDEAHRATGGYAYNQAVRFLMAKNPHFRILALTATPGSNPEAVQDLIDGLHISHVEIRDENSLDLREYVHEKKIEQHVIRVDGDIDRVKDLLARLMDTLIQPLKKRGILYGVDPVTLHPYMPQAKMQSLRRDQRWAFGPLSKLSSLARAMGYLLEGTMGMCYTYLHQVAQSDKGGNHSGEEGGTGVQTKKGSTKAKTKWRNDPHFQALMAEIENQHSRGFSRHPKLEELRVLLIQFFGERMDGDRNGREVGEQGASKAMVFVTFREAVDEIVQLLNEQQPLIRASKFIGQGVDKHGKKGMAQKEQLEIIRKFKANEFNVLVATSIGEEGLDIGEVDFIICYDAQKTPIRMLQRLGRTGRKRAGIVHVLLAEHREEFNMDKAKVTYKEVQKTIWRGDQLELYGDVERLIPDHIKPQCLERVMEIKPYVPEDLSVRKRVNDDPSNGTRVKRKRNNDIRRNMPTGANVGFVSVAELIVKTAKKRKTNASQPLKKEERDFEMQGMDDDTDLELESGSIFTCPPPPRAESSAARTSGLQTEECSKLRRASTHDGRSNREPRTMKGKGFKKEAAVPTPSKPVQLGVDRSDDLKLERANPVSLRYKKEAIKYRSEVSGSPAEFSPERNGSLGNRLQSHSPATAVLNLSDTESEPGFKMDIHPPSPSLLRGSGGQHTGQDLSWLVEDNDEKDIRITSSPPLIGRDIPRHTTNGLDEPVHILSSPQFSPRKSLARLDCKDMQHRTLCPLESETQSNGDGHDDESIIVVNGFPQSQMSCRPSSSSFRLAPSPLSWPNQKARQSKIPLLDISQQISFPFPDIPTATFPVRQAGNSKKKNVLVDSDDEMSPGRETLAARRLHRAPLASTPARDKKRRPKLTAFTAQHNPLFDVAADHSGDEASEGVSNSEDDVENESDRMFIKNSPLTQAPPSYDQSLIYRQSLLTQAPTGIAMPRFARAPTRSNAFGPNRGRRRSVELSSSPTRGGDESDEYEFGSFVVRDDAEISYGRDSSRQRPDEENQYTTTGENGADDDDDDVSLVSRSPSPEPMDVDVRDVDHIAKYDEYHRGPEQERITVDTRIKSTNKGFAMLAKLGWVEGQPLGLSGDGRVDPIPFYVKNDLTGLGKTSQDVRMIETTVAQRRELDSERQQKETEEQRKAREELVARRTALASEISSTLRAFYCALCDKQFQTITQYDEHTNSYAHHHKARLKDMQANARIVPKEEVDRRKEKERKREEKELRKIAAAYGVRMPKPSVTPAVVLAPAAPSVSTAVVEPAAPGDASKKPGGWVSLSGSGSARQPQSSGFKRSGWASIGGPSSSPSTPPPPPCAPPPPPSPPQPAASSSEGWQKMPSEASPSPKFSAPSFRTGGWTSLSDSISPIQTSSPAPPQPPQPTAWSSQPPPPPSMPPSPHPPAQAPSVSHAMLAPVPAAQPVKSGWQQFKQSGSKRR